MTIYPETDEEVVSLVLKAANENKKLRIAGAGHSSSPLVKTDDHLISLEHHKALLSADPDDRTAVLQAGITIHEAGIALQERKLSMHNTGDVDVQMLAGAFSTGTHGTGRSLQNLSTMLYGVSMVNGKGELIEADEQKDPDLMRAIRVSLGTMGIFLRLKLKLLPAYRLVRKEYFTDIQSCLDHWEELSDQNRNCDFYWYPRNDKAKIRILNLPSEGMQDVPYGKLDKHQEGWSMEVLPRQRELKFDEMEYALPAEAGLACFLKVRERMKERHREKVAWRVLVRTVRQDDNYLSTAYKRDTVTISLHHNAGLPFEDFFNDIEPIFREHDGRPHWGKKHNLTAKDLQALYPEWKKFQEYRRQMDPENVFVTPYLQKLLLDY